MNSGICQQQQLNKNIKLAVIDRGGDEASITMQHIIIIVELVSKFNGELSFLFILFKTLKIKMVCCHSFYLYFF